MIDTHSHIYDPEFDADRDLVVERARAVGVEKILLPNINLSTIDPMLALCRHYPDFCYPMMGLHPEDVKDDYKQVLAKMHDMLLVSDLPYVAVGEVGLDFYWDETYRKEQLDAFVQQVEWAIELDFPLMIHTRKAHREVVDIMKMYRSKQPRGVFHCFGGSLSQAKELLKFEGFALGIGGILTYKKSTLPEVVRSVPLERLVLETDSPYLAPVPHRGRRNESAYIHETLLRLAEEKGMSVVTNETVYRIFSQLKPE